MSLKNFILSKVFIKNLGFAIVIIVGVVMMLLIYLNFYTRHGQARPVPDFFGLTTEQMAKLAKKSRLRYQVIDSVYTTLVPRGCVAEQNPKPGFKVKKWRNVVLTINAFYPEMVAMPNLVDLPKRQAILLTESSGLEIGLLIYRPDLSIDVVIDQLYNGKNIPEGDSLQKGSVVDLVLGKGLSNQRTPVPDLIGMNLEPAKNKILASSLNLGTYIYDNTIISGEDTLHAFVYKQNPEFKDYASLQLGSVIYLWLTVDSAKLRVDSTLIISDTIPSVDLLNKTSD
ncbi:MAG: PASTA domain-containing protein [Bacteroidales bacterium]|nr:PASTA domain-containing protein [Bacteroidales bacterium]MDP3003096.1 PASTA domain-containing protein [Bacteroidales bacterium]